jgi:hypothetical protein
MDIDTLFLHQQLENIADEETEDQQQLVGLATAIMLFGAIEAHRLCDEQQKPSRLYLCQPQLLPNPRITAPWQVLYGTKNNRTYITTMGFDVYTFNHILAAGFDLACNTMPIPRNDTVGSGQTRPGARSLDASGALGLLLHYLNSTMWETSLQQIFALIPSTVS